MRDFTCDLLLNKGAPVEYGSDQAWDMDQLAELGYGQDGDRQLIVAVLKFTKMLLEHCGNRSIYASSAHLNDLLNTTYLDVVYATLEVGVELARRYQASVKRMASPSRQMSTALLANHYNIELEKVQQLALSFVKTPVIRFADHTPSTPASGGKGKEKAAHSASQKNVATMFANDLVSIAVPARADEGRWNGWGDVKVSYHPGRAGTDAAAPAPTSATASSPAQEVSDRAGGASPSSLPATPTPLRRSSTMPAAHQSSRGGGGGRHAASGDDNAASNSSPHPHRTPTHDAPSQPSSSSSSKTIEVPQSTVLSSPIYDLLSRCPPDLPKSARYEYLSRLRTGKALLGSTETRQQVLAVRLLAITNLAYIHPEPTFIEKVLKHDNDEPRRYQLVYQLAELIHPSADGTNEVPLWLQSISLALLEAISNLTAKYSDVLSALNANVNHGVLLYVIRKAVAGIRADPEEERGGRATEADEWRNSLFQLTIHMAMGSRVGLEMISAGLMDILVEILNLRSGIACRYHSMMLAFLDNLIYAYQGAFQSFSNASGLDSIAQLTVDVVSDAQALAADGKGTDPPLRSQAVDYVIPFYHQQTLKWLLKFVHHVMSNSYSYGGNTDRLLRNLVDNSQLLYSLRSIIENMDEFGAVVWTNSVTLLSDFINNDPTSFAAISESGMVQSFLETLTGREVGVEQANNSNSNNNHGDANDEDGEGDPLKPDPSRSHPLPEEVLRQPRNTPLARGILPSSDAMSIIPVVLNAISLNGRGLEMVSSSHALESYLEIFESPEHVNCMDVDSELPSSIGNFFDELARHHPALRPFISNAVIDMAARVVYMARQKAATSGWGAKLLVSDLDGKPVSADDALLRKATGASRNKGKGKAPASDSDVEMADAGWPTGKVEAGVPETPQDAGESSGPAYQSITPYLRAVSSFLSHLITNSNLKSVFTHGGGIELLLDMIVAPSLPCDFGESFASRSLSQVTAQLIESSPILGLPSLLNRLTEEVDNLQVLHTKKSDPFFAPFLASDLSVATESGDWDQEKVQSVAHGTGVLKSLLNTQMLIKVLYQSFPYSTRQGTATLPPVNVFEYYEQLISRLGPLLRVALSEEMAIPNLIPSHWSSRKPSGNSNGGSSNPPGRFGESAPSSSGPGAVNTSANGPPQNANGQDDQRLTDVLSSDATPKPGEDAVSRIQKLSSEEQASPRYLNYEALVLLVHSLMPTTFPFFQTVGKALLPRRERDPYVRGHHMEIAIEMAIAILDQLAVEEDGEPDTESLHLWIVMLHAIHEMVADPIRNGERPGVQIILPVLIAFKEANGLTALSVILGKFESIICNDPADGEGAKSKLAAIGMKKVLDIFSLIVQGKNVVDSMTQIRILPPSSDRRLDAQLGSQLVVELRLAVIRSVKGLWESRLVEKSSTQLLTKIIDILKTIAVADQETQAFRRPEKVPQRLMHPDPLPRFNWSASSRNIAGMTDQFEIELCREGVYRANGHSDAAYEYCTAHSKGLAGKRCPVPERDAFEETASPKPPPASSNDQTPAFSLPEVNVGSEPMALDSMPDIDRFIGSAIGEAVLGDLAERSSFDSNENDDDDTSENSNSQNVATVPAPPTATPGDAGPSSTAVDQEAGSGAASGARIRVAKEELDEERASVRKDMIDRCLDVIRAHPDAVHEVSELIQTTLLKPEADDDKRAEVGNILVNAIVSFSVDDIEKEASESIAAYAHLLALLLQDKSFYKPAVRTLKDNIAEYLNFLHVSPGSSTEDLPPWIRPILLIFETLLSDDEQPIEVRWKPPTLEDEHIEEPTWEEKEPNLDAEDQSTLLDALLDILPRIGKESSLAISVLRVLVILTRDRSIAKTIGEKKNLQRLFVMAKQLCGTESGHLKDPRISNNILIILRHVIEDDDTVRQIMKAEIRTYMESAQRGSRSHDVQNYLRHLSHVALRNPKMFVEVTAETVKLSRWTPNGEHLTLVPKEPSPSSTNEPSKDASSVEPAVQATEDLTISDVKPSTEVSGDKEAAAGPPRTPAQELKRPILENPDGIIHFLLCQLLSYKDIEDKDSAQLQQQQSAAKDQTGKSSSEPTTPPPPGGSPSPAGETSTPTPGSASAAEDGKDKKSSKPVFKPEEHPLFVYRCFLLHCLAELLQSYNRAKVEFINFKRSAPTQTNTPIKPRSSVLNYLLHDVLCLSSLNTSLDTVALKKKAATATQAQLVLVALVTKTGEKPVDRSKDVLEYGDEPDLVFVRRFVLDTILKAYKEASAPAEPFDLRYAKMLCLAELMSQMIGEKDKDPPNPRGTDPAIARSQVQLKRLMYEKGYLSALTASIADIDLTFPNVKRTIKHILRVLRTLTKTAIHLSQSDLITSASAVENAEDEIASATSLSDMDDDREETPDLYRNSALGMLEPGREDDFSGDSEDGKYLFPFSPTPSPTPLSQPSFSLSPRQVDVPFILIINLQ